LKMRRLPASGLTRHTSRASSLHFPLAFPHHRVRTRVGKSRYKENGWIFWRLREMHNQEQQAFEIIETRGLVQAFTDCLEEVELRFSEILRDVRNIEKTRELTEEEKSAAWNKMRGCRYDRLMYLIALERSKSFEAITSSEGWTVQ
jgi:hypothetical protein